MLVTNQTTSDVYFGPLHLAGGVGQTLTVDDTSATSLYLLDDSVADALNAAYWSGTITVSDEADPFPRPTGDPQVLHGSGDPEGLVYAPQGSIYLRRDALQTNGGGIYIKTSGVTFNTLWLDLQTAAGTTAVLPPGLVMQYGGSNAPTGWILCDGSAISRTTYSDLFTAISTNYGDGDGSTTFNVPDLRGRVPVGYAASGGHVDVSTLGNNDGVAEAYRRPKHRHTAHSHSQDGNTALDEHGGSWNTGNTGTGYTLGGTTATADGGSGNANDSTDAPAYLVMNYIIKT